MSGPPDAAALRLAIEAIGTGAQELRAALAAMRSALAMAERRLDMIEARLEREHRRD